MRKLNITDEVLDHLGFSEYWNKVGNWGYRTLTFSNGTIFRIVEQDEMEDEYLGYSFLAGGEPTYVAKHFYYRGNFALPEKDWSKYYELFFLHEIYECIKNEYPECTDEFIQKCKEVNMKPYIDEYLKNNSDEKSSI